MDEGRRRKTQTRGKSPLTSPRFVGDDLSPPGGERWMRSHWRGAVTRPSL